MRENSQSKRGGWEGEEEKNRGSHYCSQSVCCLLNSKDYSRNDQNSRMGTILLTQERSGLGKTMAQPTCPGYPKSNLASWTLFARR